MLSVRADRTFQEGLPYQGSSQTRVSGSGAQFQRASGHGGLDT